LKLPDEMGGRDFALDYFVLEVACVPAHIKWTLSKLI
jgi:hypothetical protein